MNIDIAYPPLTFQKAFTTDNRIAWTHVTVTQAVFDGEVKDDWYPLTGKQGEDKEGMINLILSYQVCTNYAAIRILH